MLQFKQIGIECKEIILTREDMYLNTNLFINNPIPLEVKYLDNNCFKNNNKYEKIIIHKGIKEIGEDCFYGCHSKIVNKSKLSSKSFRSKK